MESDVHRSILESVYVYKTKLGSVPNWDLLIVSGKRQPEAVGFGVHG